MARNRLPALTSAGSGINFRWGKWINTPSGWKAEDGAAPDQLREEELIRKVEEGWAHREVSLRNGAGRMALSKAALASAQLDVLLKIAPPLFQALRALTEGRREEISHEQVQALREQGFVTGSDQVREDIPTVMKACYEEIPGGDARIVEPFDMSDPADAALVQRFLAEEEQSSRRTAAQLKRYIKQEEEGRGRAGRG